MAEDDTYDSNWQFSRNDFQPAEEVPSHDVIRGRLSILVWIFVT